MDASEADPLSSSSPPRSTDVVGPSRVTGAGIEPPALSPPGPAAAALRGWRATFRTLSSRNYRLFFCGQGLSLIGTWMTRIATYWLIYRLTRESLSAERMLGVVAFASQIPILLLAPLAGVWADRFNRRRVLVMTQVMSLVQSASLAFLTLSGLVEVWQVVALSVFQGVINAIDTPVRQSFVVEIIERRGDLSNAIALNSSMFNGARLVGPAIAGGLIVVWGEGLCFLADAVSYVAVIAALLAMRIKPRELPTVRKKVWAELSEGFQYTFRFAPIRALILLVGLASVGGMPYVVLLPVFADRIIERGIVPAEMVYGMLMAASGLGALVAAIYLASRQSVRGLGRAIIVSAMLFDASLVALCFVRNIWGCLLLIFSAGLGMMIHMAASNTILQTIVDDDKRGRVMGFYTTAVLGLTPIGSLLAGDLATRIGAPYTVAIGGLTCLIGTLIFAVYLPGFRDQVRPIYRRMGIIPNVATGLRDATRLADNAAE